MPFCDFAEKSLPNWRLRPCGDLTPCRAGHESSAQAGSCRRSADDPLCRGRLSAFRILFERIGPWLRAFFTRSFADRAVAEDLTQATFLRLHGARESYQSGRPLKPWLFSIALGVRRDELRRRLPPAGRMDEDVLETNEALAGAAFQASAAAPPSEHQEAVRNAIRRLPDSQRVVIHLHQYDGLTFERIAERLHTTPGAVRVRASRAYELLRSNCVHCSIARNRSNTSSGFVIPVIGTSCSTRRGPTCISHNSSPLSLSASLPSVRCPRRRTRSAGAQRSPPEQHARNRGGLRYDDA